MSARDVICESLASDRYAPEEWIETAQSILDALSAAGYKVYSDTRIDPPGEPDGWRRTGRHERSR